MRKRIIYKPKFKMLNDQAIKIIRGNSSSDPPLFIYLHHDAHHPYLTDRKYLMHFIDDDCSEKEIEEVEKIQKTGNMYLFNRESLPDDKRAKYFRILKAMHDASILRNNSLLKDLIKTLKKKGLYQDSMIIISADHGEFLGERNFVSHGLYLYEEVVRVPLIIKYPNIFMLRGSSSRLVSTLDIMPTICDLIGCDVDSINSKIQGKSLFSREKHQFIVCQKKNFGEGLSFWNKKYPDHSFEQYDYGCMICLKSLTHKFVWSSKGKHSFFDLIKDPEETKNIFDAGNIEAIKYLENCHEWREKVPKFLGQKKIELDEQIKKRLRRMGYIE